MEGVRPGLDDSKIRRKLLSPFRFITSSEKTKHD
jgi:hypothetical protein